MTAKEVIKRLESEAGILIVPLGIIGSSNIQQKQASSPFQDNLEKTFIRERLATLNVKPDGIDG